MQIQCKDEKNIQPYSKVVPPEITAWLMGLRMMMYKAHVRAVRLHQKGRQHQNSIQLTWWGLKLLQMSPFYAIPTDKDGGYTLERKDDQDKSMRKSYNARPIKR